MTGVNKYRLYPTKEGKKIIDDQICPIIPNDNYIKSPPIKMPTIKFFNDNTDFSFIKKPSKTMKISNTILDYENHYKIEPRHSKIKKFTKYSFINKLEEKSKDMIPKHNQKLEEELHYAIKSQGGKDANGNDKINQDNYIYINNVFGYKNFDIFGVYDGHGKDGHLVSNYIKQEINSFFQNKSNLNMDFSSHNKTFILNSIAHRLKDDNYRILNSFFCDLDNKLKSEEDIDSHNSGSTAITIFKIKNRIICCNIGDSRAILIKKNNNSVSDSNTEIICLNSEHKPYILSEKKRILKKGGEIRIASEDIHRIYFTGKDYPGLSISRAIGDISSKSIGVSNKPEYFETLINEDYCYIVVGSDGLFDYLSTNEIESVVNSYYFNNGLPNDAVNELINKASYKWDEKEIRRDDITCIVYFIN